jgi:hypothetical protein
MNETESPQQRKRRRWITLGELIALAALIVSALGVWISWKSAGQDTSAQVVEKHRAVSLILRAKAESGGASLAISPVEPDQALESLTVTLPDRTQIQVGSDGELAATDVASALKGGDKEPKDKTLAISVRMDARYVDAGTDRRGGGAYVLHYRWEGGGLFGGRSLRLVSLSR